MEKAIRLEGKKEWFDAEYIKMIKFNGYEVYTMEDIPFPCVVTRKTFLGKKKIILVGKNFRKKDRLVKLFMLLHEIGHMKLSHKFLGSRNVRQEVEADRYAADTLVKHYGVSGIDVVNAFTSTRLKQGTEYTIRYNAIVDRYGR